MTPIDKALQLCDAFYQYLPLERYVTTTDGDMSWEYDGWENAKKCALIAVDEILSTIVSTPTDYGASWTYWMEVKQEINKL